MGHTMKQRYVDLLAIGGIFTAYSATIMLALHLNVRDSLLGGLANTIPVVIFGAIARRIILRKLIGKPAGIQLLAHVPLCAAFSILSYGLLIILLGLFNGQRSSGFLVLPFSVSGTAWQTLENVTTYALIAAMSYLQALYTDRSPMASRSAADLREGGEDRALHTQFDGGQTGPSKADGMATAHANAAKPAGDDRVEAERSRYFIRIGDELRPIDTDTVVSIGGADDYAEVWTLAEKHLVRMTLADFSRSLDPDKYIRVHRSWIVNIHRMVRAEPAGGGRLLLHMETGQTISTSRTAAKLLRDRII